ncbi:CidA/LrgA family protein [Sulfoacidibacillus thermotolerans]|uniref:CidA/LrgA family protein n=1 Tax=Sulfoacidibacillus thermotolerans TaxID=1765684 RepID=A0A2U3DAI6_SULT2|nr:CidA/LrgA family protein [Sulfoacidibacillus thermotolerans]PWI58297.1 hypothetical protein BM613_03480 [Sulfoacidibacillus thermotolerans]
MLKWVQGAYQVLLLILFSALGDLIKRILHTPIPGSIFGLLLVFTLLFLKVIRLEWLETGASFLLANLLLLFVPSAVGIIQYQHLMEAEGVRIFLVIAISTVLVMTITGWTTERLSRKREQKQGLRLWS